MENEGITSEVPRSRAEGVFWHVLINRGDGEYVPAVFSRGCLPPRLISLVMSLGEDMPIQIGKSKQILSMKLMNIDTNKEMPLFERVGSRCHFNEEILTDEYIIYLRVDWGDIKNSDPLLDADIYRNIAGAKGERIKNGSWHHTEKKYDQDSNQIIYLFKFGNLQLHLMSQISVAMSVGVDAILVREDEKDA